jgi:hypothetical protein
MAAPKFSAPDSVRSSRPKRRFSLSEANRSLPLVKRIVGDIVNTHAVAMKLQHELERQVTAAAAASRQTGQAGIAVLQQSPQNVTMQAQLDACMTKLEDFVDELSEIGCELKDYQIGLIDFVGRHDGRDVYLCWKLGEESIAYWHELDSGFAGRQPVAKLKESK